MILPLPKQFDANEITIIISTVIAFAIMYRLPRRLSPVTITIIWTFNIFLALLADITISIKPNDFYFTIDHKTHELFDIFLHFVTYPTIPYLVVNIYQYYKPNGIHLFMYVITSSGISTMLEWISAEFHVFTYTGWNLSLSFIVYFVLYYPNIWLTTFIEKRHPYKSNSTK